MVNVRLQHIADNAFVSIGNMAYHYKNKEAIVLAIHDRLSEEQKNLTAEMNVVPLFDYVDRYFRQSYELQQKYSFFFTDMLEVFRAYSAIAEAHNRLINWHKNQLKMALEFNKNRGAFEGFEFEDQFSRQVDQLWMASYMYNSYRLIDGCKPNAQDFCDQIWNILIPLMSDKGLAEYKQLRSLVSI